MGLFSNLFTWWHGPGVGTQLFTRRFGTEVGRDEQGNVYYRGPGTPKAARRWVIYNGVPEASRVPPDWHLWMHKTIDTPPSERPLSPRVWEKPWSPNPTGTSQAYAPSGALARGGQRAKSIGDYRAWTPGDDA
ncbi:NADH dehydrogenase [alpha proteobacterium AAP81b]|nr:NADH dehydrogenase [alpha proteobacterium AAP81b]